MKKFLIVALVLLSITLVASRTERRRLERHESSRSQAQKDAHPSEKQSARPANFKAAEHRASPSRAHEVALVQRAARRARATIKQDVTGSCTDSCGTQSNTGNCWCDENCIHYGDCCEDFISLCQGPPSEPEYTVSCVAGGYCGYLTEGDCHCDPACVDYEDCCADYDQCPDVVEEPFDEYSGDCIEFGCPEGFVPGQPCQCDWECDYYEDCCWNDDHCWEIPDSCWVNDSCGYYDSSFDCQCDDACEGYGDCCEDYEDTCLGYQVTEEWETYTDEVWSCDGSGIQFCHVYEPNANCQCDAACADYGDCCDDAYDLCVKEENCDLRCINDQFIHGASCQCDEECEYFGDCCQGKKKSCSCKNRCYYDEEKSCQCDLACKDYGDCCDNVAKQCYTLKTEDADGNVSIGSEGKCKESTCWTGSQQVDCYCDHACVEYGDCCQNWFKKCL